jgi:hypothetical protein
MQQLVNTTRLHLCKGPLQLSGDGGERVRVQEGTHGSNGLCAQPTWHTRHAQDHAFCLGLLIAKSSDCVTHLTKLLVDEEVRLGPLYRAEQVSRHLPRQPAHTRVCIFV